MRNLLRLFDNTGDGAWAVDRDQRVLFWNEPAERLLGWRADQALGRLCYELLNLQDAEGRPQCQPGCALHRRALQGETLCAVDASACRSDGQFARINVSLIAVPEPGRQGTANAALVHLFRPAELANGRAAGLRLRLLGPVQAHREDGSAVQGPHWARAKVRALLVMLALRRDHLIHRDLLLERLWPRLDRPAALHNLNSTVYDLRRSLEPGLREGRASRYLHSDGDCYVLAGRPEPWVDVESFERGIQAARRAADRAQARALYDQALALYRGDYVADLPADLLDCWIERERLRELFLTATQELADVCAAEGEEDRAQELCLRVLAVDGCCETAVERLMRLCRCRGGRTAAIAHYRRLKHCLRRDLGLSPSPELRLLYEEIRAEGRTGAGRGAARAARALRIG